MATYPIHPIIFNVKARTAVPSPALPEPPSTIRKYGKSQVQLQYSMLDGNWKVIREDQLDKKLPMPSSVDINQWPGRNSITSIALRVVYDADSPNTTYIGPTRVFSLWWGETSSSDGGCVFYALENPSDSNPRPIPQILATPQDPHTSENIGLAACFYLDYLDNDLDNIQNQTLIVGELMIDP